MLNALPIRRRGSTMRHPDYSDRPNGPAIPDYRHRDDYDPDGAEWLDVPTIALPYVLQIDIAHVLHYRHRDATTTGPWVEGWPKLSGGGVA